MAKGADGVLHIYFSFFIFSWHLGEAAQKSGSLPLSHLPGAAAPHTGWHLSTKGAAHIVPAGGRCWHPMCSTWGSSSVHLCVPGRGGSRTFFDCNIMTSEVRDGAEEGWRKAGGRKSLLCDSRPSLASLERWSISPCSGPCCLCEAEWCI